MEKLSDLIGKDARVAISTETPKYPGVAWFYLNGKVQHRRLYEEHFSNWPLQYIVVNGAKRLLDTSGLDVAWGLSTAECLSHIAVK